MDISNGRCLQSLTSGDIRQRVTNNNDNDNEKKKLTKFISVTIYLPIQEAN